MIESRARHPLKALRVWQRMKCSFYLIEGKDSGVCLTDLQDHASTVTNWNLDELLVWTDTVDDRLDDLIKSGHTAATGNDCIVGNALAAFIAVPTSAPFTEDWKFDARTWKSEHLKNPIKWNVLKTRIRDT